MIIKPDLPDILISRVYYVRTPIVKILKGSNLIWLLVDENYNCFSSGVWLSDRAWTSSGIWKSNQV